MVWKLPRLQFGLRGLLLLVLACAIGAWLYTNRPDRMRAFRNQQARSRIDPYELTIAGEGDAASVPPELVAILGDSRLKHWGQAGGVNLLVGDQLVTSGRDEQIRIWNTNTGRQLHKFDGKSFATSGDRRLAFFAAADSTIRCWDVATAKILKTLGEPKTANSVGMAASGDGKILVAEAIQQDNSRLITVWDVPQARAIHSFRPSQLGHGALAVSHDGQFFTWQDECQIRLSICATGEGIQTLGPIMSDTGGRCYIRQVEFSADDSQLFVGSALPAVVVFDRATGKELERIGSSDGSVHEFAMGMKERGIIFGGHSPLAVHWRTKTGRRHSETTVYGGGRIGLVDWQRNRIAVINNHGASIWHFSAGIHPWRLAGGETKAIRRLAFHPDGQHLLTGDSTGQVEVWDTGGWRAVQRWSAHFNAIETLALSADGSRLVTVAADRTAAVWNPLTGGEVSVLRGMHKPRGIGISPDGAMIIGGVRDRLFGDEFELYDVETGASLRKAGPIQFGVLSPPAWSPNGQRLAFLDQTNSLQIFETSSWKKLGSIGKTRYTQLEVVAVWLSDNRRLLTTNWGRDEIHLLEVGKPLPVLTLNTGAGQAECVAVHPSEKWIAVCGRAMPVQLWHLPTSKLVKSWQIGPPAGVVSQVAFSPDGHYLATVNGNGAVYVLSLDGVLD